MDVRIRRWLLTRVLFQAVPDLRRMLEHHELNPNLRDPELVARLAEFLDPLLTVKLRNLRPIPTHSECHDCDSYRSSHLQSEDGEWHSHCDVCMEPWPCPDAGKLDMDAVKDVREKIAVLIVKPDRDMEDEYHLWTLQRRLTDAGFNEPTGT